MHQHGVHHGTVKLGIVKEAGNRQMAVPRSLHQYAIFAVQFPQQFGQFVQLNICVSHLKGRGHHLSQRPHDGDHAFAFGNINAYTVYVHSPNTKFAIGNHLSLNVDSSYCVTRATNPTCSTERYNEGWVAVLHADTRSPSVKALPDYTLRPENE